MNRHFETKYADISYIRQYNVLKELMPSVLLRTGMQPQKYHYDNSLRTVMLIILILLTEL